MKGKGKIMEKNQDLYETAMEGISEKVVMQVIRKVIREKTLSDAEKLLAIRTAIHSFEKDTK